MATHRTIVARQDRRPRTHGEQQSLFVNAVPFVLKTGIPWDDLPTRFGKSNTVWKRFDRWSARGVWERVGHALGDADLLARHDEVQLDSTSIKAHPTASTGRRLHGEKNTMPIHADALDDRGVD